MLKQPWLSLNLQMHRKQWRLFCKIVRLPNNVLLLADIAFLTRDLDSAEKAYNKSCHFGGAETAGRASRGLAALPSLEVMPTQQLTLATIWLKKDNVPVLSMLIEELLI